MNIGEANRVRACLDCGEPGAFLWRTTKGENPGRLLRICAACLRKADWHSQQERQRHPGSKAICSVTHQSESQKDFISTFPLLSSLQQCQCPSATNRRALHRAQGQRAFWECSVEEHAPSHDQGHCRPGDRGRPTQPSHR